jgi:hypothetical protein
MAKKNSKLSLMDYLKGIEDTTKVKVSISGFNDYVEIRRLTLDETLRVNDIQLTYFNLTSEQQTIVSELTAKHPDDPNIYSKYMMDELGYHTNDFYKLAVEKAKYVVACGLSVQGNIYTPEEINERFTDAAVLIKLSDDILEFTNPVSAEEAKNFPAPGRE